MPGQIPWGTQCDAALFLHGDGFAPTLSGCSFGFDERYPVNKRLADLIWLRVREDPGHPPRRGDDGTADAHDYYGFGLVDTPGPETLIEHGFLTNPSEREWLFKHVDALAEAEYTAICRYFGVETHGQPPPLDVGSIVAT